MNNLIKLVTHPEGLIVGPSHVIRKGVLNRAWAVCAWCGKEFHYDTTRKNSGKRKYCHPVCAGQKAGQSRKEKINALMERTGLTYDQAIRQISTDKRTRKQS